MAKTISTSWTNIASYEWKPASGFRITFYLDARYSSTKNSIDKNESYIYTRLTSAIGQGSGSGYPYEFKCDYAPTVSGSEMWYFANETITESAKATIPHNADGTKSLKLSASGNISTIGLNFSISETIILDTIPRTTKLTDKVATIGEELNITWSKASSNFRHKLTYSFGDIENEVLGENLVDNFSWIPSTDLYQYIKDSASGTGTLTLTTYSGPTAIGSSTAKLTLNAKDDETTKPVIDAGWVYDSRDLTINLTGDNTKLVIGQSTAVLNLQFTSQQYATIKSLKVNGAEQSFSVTDEETYQSGVARINYQNVATNIFNIVITDSRGFVNEEYVITNEKIDYIDLDCLPTFKRIQPTTGEIGLEFDGKYFNNTFGKVANSLKISYAYKIKDDEDYSDEILLVRGVDYKIIDNTFHSGDSDYKGEINLGAIFNYKKVYNFVLYVEDEITRLVINALVVKGIPIFWWNGEKVTINGDLYLADEDGNNPINVKNLVGGGGYDSLPVGSIINFDGDDVPVGYEMVDDIIDNEEPVKTGRVINGKEEYIKRVSVTLGTPSTAGGGTSKSWEINSGLSDFKMTMPLFAFVDVNGTIQEANIVRFTATSSGITLNPTSSHCFINEDTGIISFITAGSDRTGMTFVANIYFTYN
jgi:hypothetical protein